MRPAFTANGLETFLFAGTAVLWVLAEGWQRFRGRRGPTSADRGSLLILRMCAVAGAILAAFSLRVRAADYAVNATVFAISLLLLWTGIALRLWCFRTLGRYFTFNVMATADQPVITAGPYRFLRHPSYLGLLLILMGIGISYGNWLALASIVIPVLLGLINRIRVEEAALAVTVGDRYTTFAAGRKRLLPFVW